MWALPQKKKQHSQCSRAQKQQESARNCRLDSWRVLLSQWMQHSLRHDRMEKEKSRREHAAVQVTEMKTVNTALNECANILYYHPIFLCFSWRWLVAVSSRLLMIVWMRPKVSHTGARAHFLKQVCKMDPPGLLRILAESRLRWRAPVWLLKYLAEMPAVYSKPQAQLGDVGWWTDGKPMRFRCPPVQQESARSALLFPTETKQGHKAENIQRYFLTAKNWCETINGIIHFMSHSITKKLQEKLLLLKLRSNSIHYTSHCVWHRASFCCCCGC